MSYDNELEVAIKAVRAAGLLTNEIQHNIKDKDVISKEDKSPVTIADFGSQAVITYHLSEAFPEDAIVAEEDSDTLVTDEDLRGRILDYTRLHSPVDTDEALLKQFEMEKRKTKRPDRFWTIDPIDGTKGFLRGEHYAVALALIDHGEVVLGVLGCPTLSLDSDIPEKAPGCLFHSVVNGGTCVRSYQSPIDQPIETVDLVDITQAVMCESVEAQHVSHEFHDRIIKNLGIVAQPFRIDSQCKYAAVARSQASIYLRRSRQTGYREKIWDHAAGYLIVTEAGGKVTDFQGEALDFSGGNTLPDREGIVATSGGIHNQVVAAIQEALNDS